MRTRRKVHLWTKIHKNHTKKLSLQLKIEFKKKIYVIFLKFFV